MYALFAYIGGDWGFAGVDPHEECAVMFIEQIDRQYGDGTAQVFKFPDKSNHNPIADGAQNHANAESMKAMLTALESGEIDLNDALEQFNRHNK